MIHRTELSDVRALHALAQQPSWKGFDAMLERELNAVHERMTESRDIAVLHQLQGRAQLINEIRRLVANTPSLLEKLDQ